MGIKTTVFILCSVLIGLILPIFGNRLFGRYGGRLLGVTTVIGMPIVGALWAANVAVGNMHAEAAGIAVILLLPATIAALVSTFAIWNRTADKTR